MIQQIYFLIENKFSSQKAYSEILPRVEYRFTEFNIKTLPVLQNYLPADEITDYRQKDGGIYSVAVFAQKLVADARAQTPSACCGPDCCH